MSGNSAPGAEGASAMSMILVVVGRPSTFKVRTDTAGFAAAVRRKTVALLSGVPRGISSNVLRGVSIVPAALVIVSRPPANVITDAELVPATIRFAFTMALVML